MSLPKTSISLRWGLDSSWRPDVVSFLGRRIHVHLCLDPGMIAVEHSPDIHHLHARLHQKNT